MIQTHEQCLKAIQKVTCADTFKQLTKKQLATNVISRYILDRIHAWKIKHKILIIR